MAKLKAQDEMFDTKLKTLISKTVFKDCDNEYIKGKVRELQTMHGNAKAAFEQVKSISASDKYVSQSMDQDLFINKMGQYLEATEKELNLIVED
jgi:serine protease inhibitor ecotin